jgi:hypothetical protein
VDYSTLATTAVREAVMQWPALSTMPAKECTADDETDYISLKDGKGRSHNNKITIHVHEL